MSSDDKRGLPFGGPLSILAAIVVLGFIGALLLQKENLPVVGDDPDHKAAIEDDIRGELPAQLGVSVRGTPLVTCIEPEDNRFDCQAEVDFGGTLRTGIETLAITGSCDDDACQWRLVR